MKTLATAVSILLLSVLLLGSISVTAHGADPYTVVPAGAAGPDVFFDKVHPLLEGSPQLPILARLPRILRQPLWAVYEIGEPITGGANLRDAAGQLVRDQLVIVELYRLHFYGIKAYYTLVSIQYVRFDYRAGSYRFSIPTDGLEAAFYQVRLAFSNTSELDPEFRIQIGDAVFTNDTPPPGYEPGCGCGG